EDNARLTELVAFVRDLRSASGRAMDRAVSRLGPLLLPDFVREFVAPKRRLIFSPHRSLHLFPFHAASWDEQDFFATRFAIRYVPNFTTLLLPGPTAGTGGLLAVGIGSFADPAIPPLPNVEAD